MVTCRRCRRRLNRAAGGPWPPCWRWPCSPAGLPGRRCRAPHRPRSAWSPATRQPVTQIDRIHRPHPGDRPRRAHRARHRLSRRSVLFTEGTEVKKGDLLYRLEQGPFQADVQAQGGGGRRSSRPSSRMPRSVLGRAQSLLKHAGRTAIRVDAATRQRSRRSQAQVLGAEAQLQQSRRSISTTPRSARRSTARSAAPPSPWATVVSAELRAARDDRQPGSDVRRVPDVDSRSAIDAAATAAPRRRSMIWSSGCACPTAALYGQTGKIDFVDNTVAGNTDTMIAARRRAPIR